MTATNIMITFAAVIFFNQNASSQPHIEIQNGQLRLNDGTFLKPDKAKYTKFTDSLDKQLTTNPSDTTNLFYRAYFYSLFNNIHFQPTLGQPAVMAELVKASDMVDKAIQLKMTDLRLKILRAQIYKQLCYQYGDDQSWKYNASQIAMRNKQFITYKTLANKCCDDLMIEDKGNSYVYQKMKVKNEYPLK